MQYSIHMHSQAIIVTLYLAERTRLQLDKFALLYTPVFISLIATLNLV